MIYIPHSIMPKIRVQASFMSINCVTASEVHLMHMDAHEGVWQDGLSNLFYMEDEDEAGDDR